MTHTLHPEIVDDIVNSMNHYVDEHMYHALGMKKVLEKHLGPYLLPPSQHLKDEPLPEYTTTINTKELEALKIKARKYDELCK